MKLKDLKTKLQTRTTTNIAEVIVDAFQNWMEARETAKQYPTVIWNLASATFEKDIRNGKKELEIEAWIIGKFDPATEDKLEVWDSIEEDFDDYLALMNTQTDISLEELDAIKGEYFWEGSTSGDAELGIQYKMKIKIYC